MSRDHTGAQVTDNEEHRSINGVNVKATVPHAFTGSSLVPMGNLINQAFDNVAFTNPDANGNYQTLTFQQLGVTIATLTITYDGSDNITSIAKA